MSEEIVDQTPDYSTYEAREARRNTMSKDEYEAMKAAAVAKRIAKIKYKGYCANGHPYDAENTLWFERNDKIARRCKVCHYASIRKYQDKKALERINSGEPPSYRANYRPVDNDTPNNGKGYAQPIPQFDSYQEPIAPDEISQLLNHTPKESIVLTGINALAEAENIAEEFFKAQQEEYIHLAHE